MGGVSCPVPALAGAWYEATSGSGRPACAFPAGTVSFGYGTAGEAEAASRLAGSDIVAPNGLAAGAAVTGVTGVAVSSGFFSGLRAGTEKSSSAGFSVFSGTGDRFVAGMSCVRPPVSGVAVKEVSVSGFGGRGGELVGSAPPSPPAVLASVSVSWFR